MCANDIHQSPVHDDDVWDSDNEEDGPRSPAHALLDREWEARKQQYYNAGYREGIDQGKELTLQQGFNAGFAEGAQAGYEYGLIKGAVQTLATHLTGPQATISKVQELQQQLAALNTKVVMQDTCRAILSQEPADIISRHLHTALQLTDTEQQPEETPTSSGVASNADGSGTSGSRPQADEATSSQQADPSLPQQLVLYMKQELEQLGFAVGRAPPLSVASMSTAEDAAAAGNRE